MADKNTLAEMAAADPRVDAFVKRHLLREHRDRGLTHCTFKDCIDCYLLTRLAEAHARITTLREALCSEDIRCEDNLMEVRCHSAYCRGRGAQACYAAEKAIMADDELAATKPKEQSDE